MQFAIFCGSNLGYSDVYREAAAALGRELAAQGISLVFGGTAQGLMKITADAVYACGGRIHGIIPRILIQKGKLYENLTIAEDVDTRTDRKLRMAKVADGFIAMPGGIGTLEELFEMWVNAQFEGHHKPLGLYNVHGFFDRMLEFLDGMVSEGFLPPQQRSMLITASDPAMLLEKMQAYQPVNVSKWL
jgi:uncharacterized protein (TIGR00730 family)